MRVRIVWLFTMTSRKQAIINIHAVLLRIFYLTYKRTKAIKIKAK